MRKLLLAGSPYGVMTDDVLGLPCYCWDFQEDAFSNVPRGWKSLYQVGAVITMVFTCVQVHNVEVGDEVGCEP